MILTRNDGGAELCDFKECKISIGEGMKKFGARILLAVVLFAAVVVVTVAFWPKKGSQEALQKARTDNIRRPAAGQGRNVRPQLRPTRHPKFRAVASRWADVEKRQTEQAAAKWFEDINEISEFDMNSPDRNAEKDRSPEIMFK